MREPLNADLEAWAPSEECESSDEFDKRGSMLRVAVFYQWWMREREERAAAFFPKEGPPGDERWQPMSVRQREALGVWSAPYDDPLWEAASLSSRSHLARAARKLEWDPGGRDGIPHLVNEVVRAAEDAADRDKWKALETLAVQIAQGMGSILPESSVPAALRLTAALTDAWAQRMLELGITEAEEGAARIPLRLHGAGTQRAFMVTARRVYAAVGHAGEGEASEPIVTVDEPEVGLHPHAQRALVRHLSGGPGGGTQSFIATHSPTVVQEAEASEVLVLTNVRGCVKATTLSAGAGHSANAEKEQARKNAERYWDRIAPGLFGRAALVVEGPTEMGALPVFDAWAVTSEGVPDYRGLHVHDIALVDAGGITNIPGVCSALRRFGICTVAFHDYDTDKAEEGERRRERIRAAAHHTRALPDEDGYRVFELVMAQATSVPAFARVVHGWRDLYEGTELPFCEWLYEGLGNDLKPQLTRSSDAAAVRSLVRLYKDDCTMPAVRQWFASRLGAGKSPSDRQSVFRKSTRYARMWAQALVKYKSVPPAIRDLFGYLAGIAGQGFLCGDAPQVRELQVRETGDA